MNYPNARDCEHGRKRGSCQECDAAEEIAELKELITELEKERGDLAAYKAFAVELANRQGYDSLAGFFDGLEAHNLEQEAKGFKEGFWSGFKVRSMNPEGSCIQGHYDWQVHLRSQEKALKEQSE